MMFLDGPQKTIRNPTIPYHGTILGGLAPGGLIMIHGTVPDDADRFQVDLQCGSSTSPRADVAFHFNPRFKRSGCVVCNTLEREKWGWEEITYEMPFQKGKSFEIIIMILKDKFQVAVNKKHLLLYNHRISLQRIDTLGIYGKVHIKTIDFVSNGEMPDGSQFVVPYVEKFDAALSPGCTVAIKGEVNKNPKSSRSFFFLVKEDFATWKRGCYRISYLEEAILGFSKEGNNLAPGAKFGFTINLKPSDSKDIALHLNPRMKNKVFVRNSYLSDSWGEEEKEVANFPFSPGMYFELLIFCDAHQFKVAVNGVHTLEYKHRFKQLGKIDTVEVTGDVQLLDVRRW